MPEFNDPRLTAPNTDIDAPLMQVAVSAAPLRCDPEPDAQMTSQTLYGERVRLYEERQGFGLVRSEFDHYVGWINLGMLRPADAPVTHRVTALRTYVFAEPDLKSMPRQQLSLNSTFTAGETFERYTKCDDAGWVFSNHIAPMGEGHADDPAGEAQAYCGAPYLWGGKESLGLDCSGLVQMAWTACGALLPRDSDMQFAWPGTALDGWETQGTLQRNDLIFWRGHVGIMLDGETLLHANAHHMATASEPLGGAITRIAKTNGEPTGARRIDLDLARSKLPDWFAES